MAFKTAIAVAALVSLVGAASFRRVTCPDGKNTVTNAACCVFFSLHDDLQENLLGNTCGEDAHEILRLALHDALGVSESGAAQGHGADGTMILMPSIEAGGPATVGLQSAVNGLKPFLQRHLVTAGDLIQFAGAVAMSNCPGAPRLEFLAGRPNATIASAASSSASASELSDPVAMVVNRLSDAGFSDELIHLLSDQSDEITDAMQVVLSESEYFTLNSQRLFEVLREEAFDFPGVVNELSESASLIVDTETCTVCDPQSTSDTRERVADNVKAAMARLAVRGQSAARLIDCSDAVPEPNSLVTVS